MKKGQKILVTTGDYSDYCIMGMFIVLKDFDKQRVCEDVFLSLIDEQLYQSKVGDAFLAWMTREGFLDSIDYTEMHMEDDSPLLDLLWPKIERKKKRQEILERRKDKTTVHAAFDGEGRRHGVTRDAVEKED